jgi:hypothetical protein
MGISRLKSKGIRQVIIQKLTKYFNLAPVIAEALNTQFFAEKNLRK